MNRKALKEDFRTAVRVLGWPWAILMLLAFGLLVAMWLVGPPHWSPRP
jgi:hypothetical protein